MSVSGPAAAPNRELRAIWVFTPPGITRETDTENLEYMITIKSEIQFIDTFLKNIKNDRKRFDEFITMVETRHTAIKEEAKKYFEIYNKLVDYWEQEFREEYGEQYDTDPTIDKPGGRIEI